MRKYLSYILFFLFFSILGFSQESVNKEVFNYRVDFLLIPSLNMTMKISPYSDYNDKASRQIEYIADTKKIFEPIFAVHNYYRSVYDPVNFTCLFHEKNINQSNMVQKISAIYRNDSVIYSNDRSLSIPANTHSFFSLLMHLREIEIAELDRVTFPCEMEGYLYNAAFRHLGTEVLPVGSKGVITDKIRILLTELNPGQESVIEMTDVFYWKIASGEGKKYVWIEQEDPRRIIRSKFSLTASWLTANLIDDEK